MTVTPVEDQWVAFSADIEPDVDGDLFGDETQDNCAGIANPSQADGDGDGRGDVCDKEPPAIPPSIVTLPQVVITLPAATTATVAPKKGVQEGPETEARQVRHEASREKTPSVARALARAEPPPV